MGVESIAAVPSPRRRRAPGQRCPARHAAAALLRGMPDMLEGVSRALASVEQEYADFLAEGCVEAVAPAQVALRRLWRRGRPVGRLLSAYQVGGRAAWRYMSAIAVDVGVPADAPAALAEQVFALVDRLGTVTITGYVDEQSCSVRTRDRFRTELAERLVSGRPPRRRGWR